MAGNRKGNPKSSPKQQQANRQNALRSTGPRTAAGKERVRLNPLKHGLLARDILLPDEDPNAFEELAQRIRTETEPVGVEEELLVERMIGCMWRLHRLTRVENGILAFEYFRILAERAGTEARNYEHRSDDAQALLDQLQPVTIADPAKHGEAIARQQAMARHADGDTPTLGHAFIRGVSGADALSKLSRYEANIERGFYRALHEFQRLRLARQGAHVPAPLAVDVTVTGPGEEQILR
jgi:hypothetical protein